MNKRFSIFLIALVVLPASVFAQGVSGVSKRGTTAAPFLSVPMGARATGMGGAFVAVADDPTAMYWNPAGVAELQGFHFLFDHTSWIADLGYEYFGATIGIGSLGTLGLNATASNYGEMKVTTVDYQDGTGEVFNVTDLAVGVSYGMKLTEDFAIGFNPKMIYQKIWRMSATGFAIDIGMLYRTPFKGFTLGMSVSNFGTKMQMQGENALVLYDPDPYTTGTNGKVPAYLSTDQWDLPLTFRVGLAYDLPLENFGRMKFAVDALHPSDNFECLNVGTEYAFDEVIFIRGGWKSLFQKESEEGLTLGVGVRQTVMGTMQFEANYAYQSFSRLKSAQRISVGFVF